MYINKQKIIQGQKFILTIKSLLEQNIVLLNTDIDSNEDCLEYLDFGKDFRYTLKNDGSIISETMEK